MIAAGQITEVGQLEEEAAIGLVIRRPSGTYITVKGLTEDESRAAAAMLFQMVNLTLAKMPPP